MSGLASPRTAAGSGLGRTVLDRRQLSPLQLSLSEKSQWVITMNWDAIGAVSELVAALAVVVSLLYLATQVKSNTESARTSTYQAVVSEFGALNRAMIATPDLAILFVRALEDFASLSAEEKARSSQLFFACFHNFENMYYQYRKGYLEADVWLGWQRLILSYHARPGFQVWWSLRADVFSKSFVDFLRTEKLDITIASYHDITAARQAL